MKQRPIQTVEDLHQRLIDELQVRVDAMVAGAPSDFAAYQKLVGVVTGLRVAEQLTKSLLESDAHDTDDIFP